MIVAVTAFLQKIVNAMKTKMDRTCIYSLGQLIAIQKYIGINEDITKFSDPPKK